MDNNFCVFILSYNRPDKVYTMKSLTNSGYTGKYYIVLGDDEPQIDKYIEIYGEDNILIFNKEEYMKASVESMHYSNAAFEQILRKLISEK